MSRLAPWILVAVCLACTDSAPPVTPSPTDRLPALPEDSWWTDSARCDACHGAGSAPAWATDPSTIVALRYERRAGFGHGAAGATRILSLGAEAAALDVQLTGTAPPEGLGSFAARAERSAVARMGPDRWAALVGQVASSGLFRFADTALTSSATHAEVAVVTVSREGHPDSVLASMDVLSDRQHPTLAALLASLDQLAGDLAWHDGP